MKKRKKGKREEPVIIPIQSAKCSVCGREFIPAPQHAYRDKRRQLVCSWRCSYKD